MRRWLFWRLWHVGNALDDAVCWLRSQIGRLEPPFVPTPPPEPTYDNEVRACVCGLRIAAPMLSTTPEQERDIIMARYIAAHADRDHAL